MMILALVVYVTSSIGDIAESQDRKKATEQIAEFNREYEAYNKTRMYGTDVITVVNKAINHNRTVGATEVDPYYINVIFKTQDDFKTEGFVINNLLPSDHKDYRSEVSPDKIKEIMEIDEITVALSKNPVDGYDLGSWNSDGTLQMNSGIIKFFGQNKIDKEKTENDGDENKTYYIYSALTNFKRAIFTCESMEDTAKDGKKDGRIDTIVFRQLDID